VGGGGRAGRGQPILSADNDDILDFTAPDPGGPPRERRINLAVRVLLLGAAVGLTFGTGGLLVWALTNGGLGTNTTRVARDYLIDVKNADYAKAYSRLCSPRESLQDYTTRLSDERRHGHGITSFRLNLTFTKETTRLRSASGKVTFADGSVEDVLYDVQPRTSSTGPSCIDTYDDLGG